MSGMDGVWAAAVVSRDGSDSWRMEQNMALVGRQAKGKGGRAKGEGGEGEGKAKGMHACMCG